jgi:hypothetical protein
MSINYTWTITAMDSYPTYEGQTDCVMTAHWTCSGTDGTYTSSVYSTCSIPYISTEPYTPYAQLTQQQVLGWIWEHGVDQTATEAAVAQQIANLVNPPVVTLPNPWQA